MTAPLDQRMVHRVAWLLGALEAFGPITLEELDAKTSGLRMMSSDELARMIAVAVERGYVTKSGETYTKV